MDANRPLDGLDRLTSAMTPTPGSRRIDSTGRAGGAAAAAAFTWASGTAASRVARSSRTPARIASSTLTGSSPHDNQGPSDQLFASCDDQRQRCPPGVSTYSKDPGGLSGRYLTYRDSC